jgi:hypothetical protein
MALKNYFFLILLLLESRLGASLEEFNFQDCQNQYPRKKDEPLEL